MTDYHDRLEAGEYAPAPDTADATVAELKDALGKRGLPTSGNKAELQKRLEDDDAARTGTAPTDET